MSSKDNSSTLCVVPVFDKICESPQNKDRFISLLNKMFGVNLPSSSSMPWKKICYGKRSTTHDGELHKKAPDSRLIWFIEQLFGRKDLIKELKSYKNPRTIGKRTALFQGDFSVKEEALKAIKSKQPEKWMIFEGATAPDICIITAEYVLVIEGKQTEGERTTKTKWGIHRDQLIRHMDAFLDEGKIVYGLFVYEEGISSNYNLDAYQLGKTFEESLPHRKTALIEKVRQGYLGALSWEELATVFDIKIGHKQK